MKKLKIITYSTLTNLLSGVSVFAAPIIDNKQDYTEVGPKEVYQFINSVTDIVLALAGIIAVAMIVWGGVNYMMAGGNEEKAASAKKILGYAIGGLLVVVLARLIIYIFVTVLGGGIG